jgi:Transcriptional regulator.
MSMYIFIYFCGYFILGFMDLNEVINEVIRWLSKHNVRFINARRLAKYFDISPHLAGKVLSELRRLGLVSIYKKRRGRFTIYIVEQKIT